MRLLATLFLLSASASACISIPELTYTGPEKAPANSFTGTLYISGQKTCTIAQYNVNSFFLAADAPIEKLVCIPMACNPGYRVQVCRRIGDDWFIILSTEYGEAGDFKEETVYLDVEDRGHHERTLRLEWGGCAKKNWQEVWYTTSVQGPST